MRTLEVNGQTTFGLDLCEDATGLHLSVQAMDKLPTPWVLTRQMAGANYEARLHVLSAELEMLNLDTLGIAGARIVAELAELMGAPQVASMFSKVALGERAIRAK